MIKIYWVHDESSSCGWVESERMADIICNTPCVDIVDEACYNSRVAGGSEVCEPVELWLIPPNDRMLLWEHYRSLKAKLDSLGAMVQNDGICIRQNYADIKGLEDNLISGITGFVNLVTRVPEPVK